MKPKVWILIYAVDYEVDYEGSTVVGVYARKADADREAAALNARNRWPRTSGYAVQSEVVQ